MVWTKALLFVGGAVAAGLVSAATKSPAVRSAAVSATAKVLDMNDAVQAGAQSLLDEAADVRAEAERQRKIDAAVAERMAKLEGDIREEVEAVVDGKPARKSASRASRTKK